MALHLVFSKIKWKITRMSKPGGYIPTIWAYIEANSREYGFFDKVYTCFECGNMWYIVLK